jgi:tetratricopeptide (TPR) repeat protein
MKAIIGIFTFLLLAGTISSQGKYGSTEEDSVKCVTNISLYKEHFKQSNYKDAKKGWINVFNLCPQAQKSTYINGVKMYRKFIEKEKDPAIKRQLIDTLYMIYDRRIEYYGQKAYVLGRKGSDMETYDPDDLMPAYETLKESVYLGQSRSEAGVLVKYYQVIYQLYASDKIQKSVLIEEFIPVSEFIDAAIFDNMASAIDSDTEKDKKKYNDRAEMYNTAKLTVDDIFIKIALCEDIEPIIEKRVSENPDDLKTLRIASFLLSRRECTDSEVFATVSKKLYAAEPTARSAYGLGLLMSKQKKYTESAKYLKQAVELCEDCPELEKYLLKASKAIYFENQYKSAASYARKALAINPNSGEAYLIIGMAIASSAASCSSDDMQKSAVYWLAVDYFYKAKSVDPSVADQANQYIGTYKKYYATKEAVFFANLKEGDTFMVDCWGENTKVKISE